ncbi:hypothetical protein C1H46_003489 [Malus baccata]|uniref:Uncharacterized protein n=1 Tax=Malus baccata TaxID=106549 RepID=A0A540NIQ7_MALBA|nr:hypothetical protein C1H46_003489 [Malus baccata]
MRVKKPVLTQNLLELQQRHEEDHTDDQPDAASDADQDHDQIEGTQKKDQEAIADTKLIKNTEKEQIDGNVLKVEVQRVKKGDENVILASDKEAISAQASESRNDFHTQQKKGREVSTVEAQRFKKEDENVIPGSDKEAISALESKSGSDFYTEEENGCEVSAESLKGSRKEIKM